MNKYEVSFFARWSVEYDYDYDRDCESYGCDSICRCGQITNLTLKSVSLSPSMVSIQQLVSTKHTPPKNRHKAYQPSVIEWYCIDRLLRIHKAYDVELYTASTCDGYYGEEVDNITFANADAVCSDIAMMLAMAKDVDKIKFVLDKEYSYVLNVVNDTKEAVVEKLDPKTLTINTDYALCVKRGASSYEFMGTLPVGVVHNGRLIDGYHRRAALDVTKKHPYIVLR